MSNREVLEVLQALKINEREYFLIKIRDAILCVLEFDESFYSLSVDKNVPARYFSSELEARKYMDKLQ